jgi:serine/threonine-protein kinase RsbW
MPTRPPRTLHPHPNTPAASRRASPPPGNDDHVSVAVRVFPGHPQQIAAARRWAATLAAAHGASHADACLITSELATNAVQHTRSSQRGGTITVAITSGPGQMTIHVHDLGTTTGQQPTPQPVTTDEHRLTEGNRGLWIVTVLGTGWGTRPATCCPVSQPGDPATVVGGCTWCTLPCQPHQHSGRERTPDQAGMAGP